MTQERIAKLSSIGFNFSEKRWNTGKMNRARAAIERGGDNKINKFMNKASSSNSYCVEFQNLVEHQVTMKTVVSLTHMAFNFFSRHF
jgi:hypothetical protein